MDDPEIDVCSAAAIGFVCGWLGALFLVAIVLAVKHG